MKPAVDQSLEPLNLEVIYFLLTGYFECKFFFQASERAGPRAQFLPIRTSRLVNNICISVSRPISRVF